MLVPAIEPHFLSQLLDLKIERVEFILFGHFRLGCQDVWSPHSGSGAVSQQVSLRCSASASLSDCRACSLSVPLTDLLPQRVALIVFSSLTLGGELLHIGGFSKNTHFRLVLTSR